LRPYQGITPICYCNIWKAGCSNCWKKRHTIFEEHADNACALFAHHKAAEIQRGCSFGSSPFCVITFNGKSSAEVFSIRQVGRL
jgi:hypothetical protein